MEICSEELIRLRRHFHAHPELSMQEFETSAFVESYLTGLGLPPRRLDANGLVATVFADDPERKPTVVIRAGCHRDYYALRELVLARLEDIQTETGVSMDIFIEDRPIPPIQSDGELVDIGLNLGREIWGDDCRLVDAHHLSGDSAAFYFHRARGIFAVFTAEKDGNRCCPLHSGAFDFDEGVMEKAVEFLCKYIQALPNPKESAQSS